MPQEKVMALTLPQVENVCLWGHGAKECRYLEEDGMNNRFYCLKLIADKRNRIDAEIHEFVSQAKSRGIDPSVAAISLGDNCSGYTFLKHKMQGYDLP